MTNFILTFLLLGACGTPTPDHRLRLPRVIPSSPVAQALAYTSLADSNDEVTEGNAIYDICSQRNESSIEDMVPLIGIVSEKGKGRTIGGGGAETMYPVVVLLNSTYPHGLPSALNVLSSQNLTLDQKLQLIVFISEQLGTFYTPDLILFMNKQAEGYREKSRRCEALRKSLGVEDDQQEKDETKSLVLPLTRVEEIKGWTIPHAEKIKRAQVVFGAENNVELALQRNDLVALSTALGELNGSHFQMSASTLARAITTLPPDVLFSSSAQSTKLRQSFQEALKSIGSPANHAIVEALVTYGKDVQLRSFLLSCLVDTAGSTPNVAQVLQASQIDYEKRAVRLETLIKVPSIK